MRAADHALESMLRRDRLVFVFSIVAIMAVAWTWILFGAGMGMSAVAMTHMTGMDGWLMQQTLWTPQYAMLMFFMWWVMMIAMMLPSASPVLLLFARINRRQKTAHSPFVPTSVFAAGYLFAWGGFSLIAVGLQWTMETTRLMSPMMKTSNVWLGAAILVCAGLWQLTPIKTVCLHHCRTPLGFLIGNWRHGRWGAFRMGLGHGVYCLGCCWFLMTLLFFGGVMNLYWIVGLAAFVLLEKTIPFGHWLARTFGIALVGWGLLLPVL